MTKRKSNEIDAEVGRNLKKIRRLRGETQIDLANASGISYQQVQKYERGSVRISASRLYQFSKILGVPIQAFFDGITTEIAASTMVQAPKRYINLIEMLQNLDDPKVEKALYTLVKTYSDQSESDL